MASVKPKISKFSVVGLVVLFFTYFFTHLLFRLIYSHQPTLYIDELFHIPQAQLFCKNNWTHWDSKITTLPGLYFISYAILKPVEYILSKNLCTVYGLRYTNLFATFLNVYFSFHILRRLLRIRHERDSIKQRYVDLLSAFNIAMFPPLYFFTFLYYTDVWSVTAVLFMYYQHLQQKAFSRFWAGIGGLVAIFLRQTNIVWVGLLLIDAGWSSVLNHPYYPFRRTENYKSALNVIGILKNYIPFSNKSPPVSDSRKKLFIRLLKSVYPYLILCLMFLIFVAVNGGVVVGDKKAHTVVFHPLQNLYFLGFVAFFSSAFFLYEIIDYFKEQFHPVKFLMLLGLSCILCHFNKLEHPYLLADNRHYTFYLWKRFLGHPVYRFAVTPGYIFSGELLYRMLKRCDFIFLVGLSLCICINLTSQHLFELRYFILPYIMCRLHYYRQASAVVPVFLETLLYILVNAVTIYLFLNKPFSWKNEPENIQRFIW